MTPVHATGATHHDAAATTARERPEHRTPVGSGDFYQAIVEAVPQLVWTCLPNGECDYLGLQWVAYTGIPAAPQLGYKWTEQLHPDDRASAVEAWKLAASGETLFDTEFRVRRHDGVYRWFKTRAVPRRDESGCLVRRYGTNTDIHREGEVEDALRSSARELDVRIEARTQQLRALNVELASTTRQLNTPQRISHVGSWRYHPASGEVSWSDELFRIAGLPRDSRALSYAMRHLHA